MMLVSYHHDVRTTITLDPDTIAQVREAMRQSGRSFKDTINDAIRAGLTSAHSSGRKPEFRIRAQALGIRPGLSYDNVADLIEQLEGPSAR
jgi:hypothetical protein